LGKAFNSSAEGRQFNSKTEQFIPNASVVSIHHLRDRAGLVGCVGLK